MSNRSTRRFTPHEENYAVAALLGDCGGADKGRPYLALETCNGRDYWVIRQPGLGRIRTGIRQRDVMQASIELRQVRWVWSSRRTLKAPKACGTSTSH